MPKGCLRGARFARNFFEKRFWKPKKRAVVLLVSRCFGKFWYKVFFMCLGQGKMSALFPVLPVAGWASKNKRVQKNMQSVPRESISTLPRHQEFAKKCKPFQKNCCYDVDVMWCDFDAWNLEIFDEQKKSDFEFWSISTLEVATRALFCRCLEPRKVEVVAY